MLHRSLVVVVLVALAGSLVSACGGGDDDRPVPRSDQPLEGTQWILDQTASRLVATASSAVVTAQFSSDGSLAGTSGCNRYATTYSVDGSRLEVDGPIAGTLMLCEADVMRVEQAYLERLPRAESFSIRRRVLTIETGGAGRLVFEALDSEQALAGDWEVTGFFRPGAVVSPVAGSTLTASFDAGRISGDSGCNQYSGPYEVDDTKIAIGPLASTLRACADPAVGDQETQYLAALELARTFSLDGGGLTLLRDDGGIAVTFARA